MNLKAFIADHWPILGALAAGLVAWGVTTADIQQLKLDRDKSSLDHDTLIEIRTKQETMQRDVEEIKQLLKDAVTQRAQPHR